MDREATASTRTRLHSPLMLSSLMIGPHFATADFRWAASSAGDEGVTSAPISSSFSFNAGCASTATVSSWTRRRLLALNAEKRCPLECRQVGDNRTRYARFEFCRF